MFCAPVKEEISDNDKELANAVKAAARLYNEAVKAALDAGLSVHTWTAWRLRGELDKYISDNSLVDITVKRITTKNL